MENFPLVWEAMTQKAVSTFRQQRWWRYLLAPAMGWLYFLTAGATNTYEEAILSIVLLFVSYIGFASFGYWVNDIGDIETDQRAHKTNNAANYSTLVQFVLAIVALSVGVLPWFWLPVSLPIYILLLTEVFLLLAYSFKPLRVKEKKWIAPVIDSLYAYVLPFAVFTLTLQPKLHCLLFVSVLGWKFVSGIRYYLNHLVHDAESDKKAGLETLATRLGKNSLLNIIESCIVPLEVILLITVLFFSFPFNGIYIFVYLLLLAATITAESWLVKQPLAYSFHRFQLDTFYQTVFPFAALFYLISHNGNWIFLFLVHVFLFYNGIGLLTRTFVSIRQRLLSFPYRQKASLFANYAVYYFRKYVLFYSEEKARKSQYPEYLLTQERKEYEKQLAENGRIAIVNINRAKYTETFIHGMKAKLPFQVHYLFGRELPLYSEDEGSFLPETPLFKKWIDWLEILLNKPENYYARKAIIHYLRKHKIELVLAEFGPVGAAMAGVCEEAGIPLIVRFHGYDLHHSAIVQQNKEAYKKMFLYASCIIVVAKEMQSIVVNAGVDESKVFYLPDYVNLDLFRYVDTSRNPPVFLAIGRFAETKSPHLTILAFNEVLKKVPDARLVMIGKGGGGELFEACRILVKSLGIENHVQFKGVLSPIEVYKEMTKARVFVQHSLTTPEYGDKEGTPVAVMEASAAGLPVVATRHAGIRDIVVEGETGILVDEYDYLAMAEAMVRLAQNDDLVHQMGKNGSKYIHNHDVIKNYLKLLSEAVKKYKLYK